jgi:diguanylate cyclase (GGDEF)-like protein
MERDARNTMFHMEPVRLQQMLEDLREASRDHEAWYGGLLRCVVCRVDAGPHELEPESHRNCRFGRWYYGAVEHDLRRQPAYAAIESEHVRLHRLAARILRGAAAGAAVSTEDYDALVAGSARLRSEIDSLRHEIEEALRSRDPVTGAAGRIDILPAVRDACELVRRGVHQACVAFMDLDRFKDVNDFHGHTSGDRVLAGAVRYAMEHLRSYDRVFRYGGDEFLLLLPGAHIEVAHRLVDRLRAGLADAAFAERADGQPLRVTASFGVTPVEPGVSAEEVIDRADRALLLAKAVGRNRVMRWDPSVTTGRLAAVAVSSAAARAQGA